MTTKTTEKLAAALRPGGYKQEGVRRNDGGEDAVESVQTETPVTSTSAIGKGLMRHKVAKGDIGLRVLNRSQLPPSSILRQALRSLTRRN